MIGNAKHFVLPGGEEQVPANAHHGDFPKQSHGVVRLVCYVPNGVVRSLVGYALPARAWQEAVESRGKWKRDLGGGRGKSPGAGSAPRPTRGSKNSDLTFVLLHGASKHLKRPTQGQPEILGVFGDT